PLLGGVVRDLRRPVDGALAAQLLEQRVRRPVQPLLTLGDERLFEGQGVGGHGLTLCQRSRSKTSSRPSRSSICSPTCANPNAVTIRSDRALSGLTEARAIRTPFSRAYASSSRTAACA